VAGVAAISRHGLFGAKNLLNAYGSPPGAFRGKVLVRRAINGFGIQHMRPRLAITAGTSAPSANAADFAEAMYGQHLAKVKRWARRLAGPSADLEDLVHDIFLVAIRKGFQFRGEATIDTWLFGITQRLVWTRRRKSRLRQWLFGQNQDHLVPPEPRTPQHELERREQSARLYRALDRLPDVYRTTLILYELEELSGEEVARLTGVPLGTVWVRLHRGRDRLTQILSRGEQA
jgi:RNA polymerase sigma-70 factor, ECF subfamily